MPPPIQRMTQKQLFDKAKERFGNDPRLWAFVCLKCGDIATRLDFPPGKGIPGQECVGRYVEGRGCRWTSYGLHEGPVAVEMPGGWVKYMLELAPAPEGDDRG